MGRTIPSYRIATEIEKAKWKPFRQMLDRNDKKLFDEMLSYPKLYNSTESNAVRPTHTKAGQLNSRDCGS